MELWNFNIYTLILFLVILLVLFYIIYLYINKIKNLSDKSLLFTRKISFKYLFLFLSFFLVLITIFQPKWWELKNNNEAKWIDVVFTLDVSKSMNVADISDNHYNYTRLDIVKNAIWNFVSKYKEDRFWLVIFAWDAISSVPLTLDHDVFLTFLKWVDYRNILKQWTDLKKAVKMAVNRFDLNDNRSKVVVIVSDWADSDYKIDIDYFKQLKNKYKNIKFFVVWVWTDKWWMIIKWNDVFWRQIYQKYNWKYVISKINRNNLELLASSLWAKYVEIKNIWDLNKISWDLNKLDKEILNSNINWEKNDLTRIFVFISFILFLIYMFWDFSNFLIKRWNYEIK